MKKQFYIPFLILFAVSFVGVSCAASKVPVATCEFEKALIPTKVEFSANFHGAIVYRTVKFVNYEGTFSDVLTLNKLYFRVDETFYRTGYKAKLSTAVKEILAPPDYRCKECNTGFKV